MSTLDDVLSTIDANQSGALERLFELLAIPSISTVPEHYADCERAADWLAAQLQAVGFEATKHVTEGRPMVLGAAKAKARDAPSVLFYGHYDVQPPDPLDLWTTPPFEPRLVKVGDDERIVARGAADDKGQVLIQLKAVEELMQSGNLPVNVRFLIEGEEEAGGEHIEGFVASGDPRLRADAAVVCDTEMFAPGLPTICVGLRGIVYGEIEIVTAASDLHSGVYGGAAPNAIQAAAELITSLKGRDGRIHIDGFTDRVVPPSPEERAAWNRLPFNEAEYRDKEVKATTLTGEPDFDVFERTWARPTFEVHGIRGGFTAEGAKTVIPARATIKVSMRLVADQRPEKVVEQLRAAVSRNAPAGASASFRLLSIAAPSLVNPANRFIQTAADVMTGIFGKQTVFIRSGGSIPIVGLFDRHLGIPSVMMGFGLPDDNLHAPNEKFHLDNFYRGMEAVARYLVRLGN